MKELKTVAMSFRVSPRFKQYLSTAAERERRSQANFLEQLVFDYCEKNEIEPKPLKNKKSEVK